MKRIFTLILVILPALAFAAVKSDSVKIEGKIMDSFSRQNIIGAVIRLLDANGIEVAVDTMRDEKWNNYGDVWEVIPAGYKLKVPKADKYTALIEAEGYEFAPHDFVIPEKRYYRKVTEWQQNFMVKKAPAQLLGGAVVRASRIKMFYKGDTVVYNADAFQLSEGSMLDNLLKAMPGMELKPGGVIEHNGQRVEELLVNGKDFFAGDPKIALENLPAYTVNQVKVYRKDADDAFLIKDSLERDRRKKLVVDVRLKKEYNTGWLANAEAGRGTSDKYMARLFLMRFTDRTKLYAWGQANNIGDNVEANSSGNWYEWWRPMGTSRTRKGGLTFNADRKDKRFEYTGKLNASHTDILEETMTSTTNFFSSGDTYGRSNNQHRNHEVSLNFNNSIKYQQKANAKFYEARGFYLRSDLLDLSYERRRNNSLLRSLTFNDDPKDSYRGASLDSLFSPLGSPRLMQMLISQMRQESSRTSTNLRLYHNTYFSGISPIFGMLYDITIWGDYTKNDRDTYSLYNLLQPQSPKPHTQQHRFEPASNINYNFNGRLKYMIWKVIPNVSVNLYYTYEQHYTDDKLSIYHLDSIDGWSEANHSMFDLPSNREALFQTLDLSNSHTTMQLHRNQHIMIQAQGFGGFYFELPINILNASLRDNRPLQRQRVGDNHTFLDPKIGYQIWKTINGKNVRRDWSYSISHIAPSIMNMLNITDTSNPLVVNLGNPNLKSTQDHHFEFNNSISDKRHTVTYDLSWFLHEHMVATARLFDPTTGVSTLQSRNIEGNWEAYARFNYESDVDKKAIWRLGTNTDLSYLNNADYASMSNKAERSSVQTFTLNERLKATYNHKKTRLELTASANWRTLNSKREDFNRVNAWTFNYSAQLSTELPLGLQVESDFNIQQRTGYADRNMNDTRFVWNATLTRSFLRGKALTLKLQCFDLLNSLQSTHNEINAQGRTETWYNVQPRYLLLRAIYKINGFKKKKKEQ